MKRLKNILMLICMLTASIVCIWGTPNNGNDTDKDKTILLIPKVKPQRPNAPFYYFIECHYGRGYMEFSIPAGFEYLIVSIRDGEYSVWEGMVSPENPYTEIPDLSGEYTVVCTSDGNHTFVGTIYL